MKSNKRIGRAVSAPIVLPLGKKRSSLKQWPCKRNICLIDIMLNQFSEAHIYQFVTFPTIIEVERRLPNTLIIVVPNKTYGGA